VVIIAVVLAIAAIALITIGYLGWTERLPRNQWAGIRTKTTMSSDEVWRVAHRKAGPWLTVSGVVMLPAAALSGFADTAPLVGIAGGVLAVVGIFGVAGGAMTASDAARKALRDEVGRVPQERR
jgi:uncharacterized membrane protein